MTTFDERAPTWDSPDRIERAERLADVILAAVDLPAGCRAIELGAGTGLLGLAIRGRLGAAGMPELLLTDTSTGMLQVASDKVRDRGLRGVATERFDVSADPPPRGAPFDLALSLLLLHHVEDTATAFRRIAALLRPGGRLALADLDSEDGSFHAAEAAGIHHHGFDRERLREVAVDAGFADVRLGGAGSIERDGRPYPLFLLVARRT